MDEQIRSPHGRHAPDALRTLRRGRSPAPAAASSPTPRPNSTGRPALLVADPLYSRRSRPLRRRRAGVRSRRSHRAPRSDRPLPSHLEVHARPGMAEARAGPVPLPPLAPLGEHVVRVRQGAADAPRADRIRCLAPSGAAPRRRSSTRQGRLSSFSRALQVESYEREEYLLFSGFEDDGASLDQETMEKLFGCSGHVKAATQLFQTRLPTGLMRKRSATPRRRSACPLSRTAPTVAQQFAGDETGKRSAGLQIQVASRADRLKSPAAAQPA